MPVTTHSTPSATSLPIWAGAFLVIRPMLRYWPLRAAAMKYIYKLDQSLASGPYPKGVRSERIELAGREADYILPTKPSGRDADVAVLYLHGGAFIMCGLATHRVVASRLSKQTELPVFSLAYRQLPTAGVGTSVHDAYAAYRELLLDRGYRHVVVAGDSAGGFLSGKIVELAAADGIAAPAGFVGFSPLLDLDTASNPDRSSRSDAYLPKKKMAKLAPLFDRGPIPLRGTRNLRELPTDIFPPTIIISACDELLEPDIIGLVEKIDAEGGSAQLHRYRWQVHAFPALAARHRESLDAISRVAGFITSAMRAAVGDEHSSARQSAS